MAVATDERVKALEQLALEVYLPLTPYTPPNVSAELTNPSLYAVSIKSKQRNAGYSQLLWINYNTLEVNHTNEPLTTLDDQRLIDPQKLIQRAELLTAALGFKTISIDEAVNFGAPMLTPRQRVFWAGLGYRFQPSASGGLPGESPGRWVKQV